MSQFEAKGDNTKIARQADADCDVSYFAEDAETEYPCILPAGHEGKHMDPTGIEFDA